MNLEHFLEQIKTWANDSENIIGVLLVGSHARGEARPDSDIDLVIVCKDPGELLNDLSWINKFGVVDEHTIEDWGLVKSVRTFYQDGPEIEFGITDLDWMKQPLDPGTQKVVSDGYQVLVDKTGSLQNLIK